MKTAILGAGAMGSMVGAHLKKGGGEVWFVDVYQDHMDAVAKNGLYMELERQPEPQTVMLDGATSDGNKVGVCDLVIILVKCVDTATAIEANRALFGKDTVVLTLQNGVGSVDIIKEYFDDAHIGFGMLKASATLFAPGKIFGMPRFPYSEKGVYFSPLSADTPYQKTYDTLAQQLTAGGMPAECSPETEFLVWDKLYSNVLFNAIGALLQLANEDSAPHEDGMFLMKELGRETCEVARAKGLDMDTDKYWAQWAGKPARIPGAQVHYVSAVLDAYKKRKTEVDFLNGAVVKEGKKHGIPTPYNEALWHLTRLMQDTYDLRFTPRED